MAIKSNCNLWAWREFIEGRTEVIVLRKSSYSRWRPIAARPWWRRTLSPIGGYAAYPVWFILQCCYFLLYGTWMHTTTDTHEFAPKVARFDRWVPPLHYEGEVREIDGEQRGGG